MTIKGNGISTAEMRLVRSSTISAIGYDHHARTLFVRFRRTRETYAYYDVEESVFNAFLDSRSKGQYFNENVRDRYKHTKPD